MLAARVEKRREREKIERRYEGRIVFSLLLLKSMDIVLVTAQNGA